MPYVYRISRRSPARPAATVAVTVSTAPEPVLEAPEPSYRDLQAQAKDLDIPANQTADDLKKAIQEAEPDD